MNSNRIAGIILAMAALHVAVLSLALGPRHLGYVLTAILSATIVWGLVCRRGGEKRAGGITIGAMIALISQQVACHVWRAELPGFWWPLAQFAALHSLVAFGLGRAASCCQVSKRS